MTRTGVLLTMFLLSSGLACRGASLHNSIPITPEQVATAVAVAGLHVTARDIALPARVVASTTDPVLKVDSIEHWTDAQWRVRIKCANSGDCLPFFVAVHALATQNGIPAFTPAAGRAQARDRSTTLPDASKVRAGSPATLLLEGDHIRIQIPVVCLQNGRTGETVRVRSKDGQQLYCAQVVDRDQLKGGIR